MDCFYINLEGAVNRRRTLEHSFRDCMNSKWRLYRYRAVDGNYVRRAAIPGTLTDAEKACFLSHRDLIQSSLGNSEPILVLEDDAILGSRTCEQLEELVFRRDPSSWDLAFTDFIVPDLACMAGLLKLRQKLAGEVRLLDLSTLPFAGSTAYLINGRSKALLAGLLASVTSLDVPYDLFLRNHIYAKGLTACGFFPFITSLSSLSEQSDIQPTAKTATLIWDAFRKLSWMDRDIEREKPLLQSIASTLCDEECSAFGTIFAAMLSKAYQPR
jgi:GR25 family glycosyltransferase involved in LPS biosynthesis